MGLGLFRWRRLYRILLDEDAVLGCLVLHFLLLRQKKTKQKKRRLRANRSAGSKQLYAVGQYSIRRHGAGFLPAAFFLLGYSTAYSL